LQGTRDPYPPSEETIRWLLESVGSGGRIVSLRPLLGGTWHANHAVDVIDGNGRVHELVLRRWARPGWEQADPDFTAEREAGILELLSETPVLAPLLVSADPSAVNCDVPTLLITRLPGEQPRQPEATDPYLDQLAAALLLIHSVDGRASNEIPGYRRYHDPEHVVLADLLGPSPVWHRAVEIVARPAPDGPRCFIHRDYHSGNTLWSGDRLTGVIDWTQGSWGPPSIDLGHMRWNLAVQYGPEVAARFLEMYEKRQGATFEHDRYWDVVTLVDFLADVAPASPLPRRSVDQLERYLTGVLAAL
jgi:aminoglycoside phosphotransferase (APT) family kinase protein